MGADNNEYSKSKQKRMAIQDAKKQEEKRRVKTRVIATASVAAAIGAFAAGSYGLNKLSIRKYLASDITAETDFSAHLKSNGKIDGVNVSDYVKDFDIADIEVNADDVEYTDEDLDSAIASIIELYKELDTDETREAASGDTLNINYVGTVDGEEFDGGTADEQDLELGSGTFIDGFEDQLVGAKPGQDITVNVTFPDDYGVDDLNGKDAEFAVHVNGIYETPEFNDAFVQENLVDSGYTTADEYKTAYKEQQIANLYDEAVDTWIGENVTLDSYPEVYLHYMKGIQMTQDSYMYTQYKSLYEQYGLDFDYDSYEGYFTTDDQTYEEYRDEEAKEQVTKHLVYQKVFEDAGLKVTDTDYQDFIEKNNIDEDTINAYGKAYIMQQVMDEMAIRYMQDKVTVVEETEDATANDTTAVDSAETAETSSAEDKSGDNSIVDDTDSDVDGVSEDTANVSVDNTNN